MVKILFINNDWHVCLICILWSRGRLLSTWAWTIEIHCKLFPILIHNGLWLWARNAGYACMYVCVANRGRYWKDLWQPYQLVCELFALAWWGVMFSFELSFHVCFFSPSWSCTEFYATISLALSLCCIAYSYYFPSCLIIIQVIWPLLLSTFT